MRSSCACCREVNSSLPAMPYKKLRSHSDIGALGTDKQIATASRQSVGSRHLAAGATITSDHDSPAFWSRRCAAAPAFATSPRCSEPSMPSNLMSRADVAGSSGTVAPRGGDELLQAANEFRDLVGLIAHGSSDPDWPGSLALYLPVLKGTGGDRQERCEFIAGHHPGDGVSIGGWHGGFLQAQKNRLAFPLAVVVGSVPWTRAQLAPIRQGYIAISFGSSISPLFLNCGAGFQNSR